MNLPQVRTLDFTRITWWGLVRPPMSASRYNYKTHDQARRDVFAYIEGVYNRKRLHSALGYRTPDEMAFRAA